MIQHEMYYTLTSVMREYHLEAELRVLLQQEETAVDEDREIIPDGGRGDDVEDREQPANERGDACW